VGVKRTGDEAYHSLPASAEVKKMWVYITIPPFVTQHRDNFTLIEEKSRDSSVGTATGKIPAVGLVWSVKFMLRQR
jgi:hypothetical protein